MPSTDVAVNMPASISSALIGKSPTMQNTFKLLARLSSQSVPVLIKAETGSGKPLIARTLHEMGQASDYVFETVSLSQLPTTAHDEILFGAEGLYHKSEGSSLFINGIEGLSSEAQMSLARRMESSRAPDDKKKAPRIIAGTHLDLKLLVDQGLFREDLFFDLSVGVLKVPPLRDRLEDIGQLASHFCEQFNQEFDTQRQVSADAVGYLQSYHWPGNVRELENLIRRMFISNNDATLSPESFSHEMNASQAQADVRPTNSLGDDAGHHIKRYFAALKGEAPAAGLHKRIVSEVERPLIEAALYFTKGNQIKAAYILGLNRNTLRKKIRDLNISARRADYRAGGDDETD
jgi:two-component system nitrogen regulation response regulator GlnG